MPSLEVVGKATVARLKSGEQVGDGQEMEIAASPRVACGGDRQRSTAFSSPMTDRQCLCNNKG